RRAAQLRAVRDDLTVTELRGNVDTRLIRLAEGRYDAIVIAAAGLERLGRLDAAGALLDELVPAPGQGTIALEARDGDDAAAAAAAAVTNAATWCCLAAERALVRGLDASCHTPLGAHARIVGGATLVLESFVGLPDGSAWLRDRVAGPATDPEALGAEAAQRLLAAGARDLLDRAEAGAG
ncbi:MAG TPA: hypothetical protein VH300_07410, partial [Thermoleophilaceae bacterium]|nr:hypothetical protein [Thermoleophilaceae bacterium]